MLPHGVDLKDQEVAGRVVRVSFCVVLRKPGGVTRWTVRCCEGPLLPSKEGGPVTT